MDIHKFLRFMPDKTYLNLMFFYHFHRFINWKQPQTFNEKLQWLKLNDRKPEYTVMVDKVEVKKFVAERIGEQYLIPTLNIWNTPDEINIDVLPERFVLKCSHDSGSIIICKSKKDFDLKAAKEKLQKKMKRNGFVYGREWPYKNVTPRILAEKYMEDSKNQVLIDYKVMCFNGQPEIIEIHKNRFSESHTQDFYDTFWKSTDIIQGEKSETIIERPVNLEKMLSLSKVLSKGTVFLRVDWYEVEGKLYFGELTFYDASGFEPFDDSDSDLKLGKMIDLDKL